MSAPVIALWTVPRSASTAFERMMAERGDLTVVHEPFSLHYYYGANARSPRFAEVRPASSPDEILDELAAAARDRPVFVKDMAYHVAHLLDTGDDRLAARLVEGFVHTFLVRDPAWTLPSLAAMWPDFTDEETGFEALDRLVAETERVGRPAVIVDSDDLRRDPAGIVRAYCDRVGLPFRPDALRWEPGMRGDWALWEDWHRDTAATTGFLPPSADDPPPMTDPRVVRAYERCRPVYDRLAARRLRAS